MNKTELIAALADQNEITKAASAAYFDALTGIIAKQLKKGETVAIAGFGTFSVKKRAARTGRNPATGATIKIKASKAPSFKAGKGFKDAIA